MKVLYDFQAFSYQDYGGVSRYYYELITRIKKANIIAELNIEYSNNVNLTKELNNHYSPFFPSINFKGKRRLQNEANQFFTLKKIKDNKFDLFHATYYDTYFLKSLKKPLVSTFYDLIHEKYGNNYKELVHNKKLIEQKKSIAQNASLILAISETTKNDLIDIFNINPTKIVVTYLASPIQTLQESTKYLRSPYLLFVGNRSMYKNFNIMLEAIAQVLHSNNLYLICAGGGSFNNDEQILIKKHGLQARVNNVKIFNDNALINFYKNAKAFIFPSLYEGFGLPLLEAFSCGCPVLSSNTGSLPEIGGDACIYFNPLDQNDIENSVNSVINNTHIAESLINKGYERLKEFSWERTAEKTINAYKLLE